MTGVLARPMSSANSLPAGRSWLLRDLERPGQAFSYLTPNWFAAVMGTGIVATAAASLPVQFAGLHSFGLACWVLAAVLLVAVCVATGLHWRHCREVARGHLLDPVMSFFYGAPPMALLTVGAGTLLLGRDILGAGLAVDVDWVLWFGGTLTGLVTAVLVPYLMHTRQDLHLKDAVGGWLMPIVPPMVSASTGALLVPYAPSGHLRLALLLSCYAMFVLSLLASTVVITLICVRLVVHGVPAARTVPTLWIVLGPMGQSITAINLLGGVASLSLSAPRAHALDTFALGYGIAVWGLAVLWGGIALTITARTVRAGLPFSLTWWSFTFPVGTLVTGTSGLALHTGDDLFRWAAFALYVALVCAWVTVAARTASGASRGALLLAPAAVPATT